MTESLSRRPCRCRWMGVSPCGAQVRTTVGIKRKPIKMQIRCGRPAAQRFFYPGPLLFLPALDLCIFPLQGAPLGFLRTPFQAVHQPTDMIAVIADSELQIGRASCRERV